MRRELLALTLVAAASSAAASPREPVVVELFTSQGCASCPPADALLARLAEREDVIPLALHVDYWDYIGWVDAFGSPAFTKRQKGYARAHGSRTIYTPQMVVAGRAAVVGHKPMELAALIMDALDAPRLVDLGVALNEGTLDISVRPRFPIDGEVLIQLVRYIPSETIEIGRGENAGQTITYRNIVTAWETLATWNGRDPITLSHEVEGEDQAVVLVQQAGYGAILAAARAR